MFKILTAVCLATVQDRAAQIAQRRSDSGLARHHVWRKADIRHKQSLSPGNYRAEVVSRRNVEPMGAGSPRVSDMKILRDATTRDTTWENWIRDAFLNDIVHVVFTAYGTIIYQFLNYL